jgi:hypothetical protein
VNNVALMLNPETPSLMERYSNNPMVRDLLLLTAKALCVGLEID